VLRLGTLSAAHVGDRLASFVSLHANKTLSYQCPDSPRMASRGLSTEPELE
jgi:hypothetical protein